MRYRPLNEQLEDNRDLKDIVKEQTQHRLRQQSAQGKRTKENSLFINPEPMAAVTFVDGHRESAKSFTNYNDALSSNSRIQRPKS